MMRIEYGDDGYTKNGSFTMLLRQIWSVRSVSSLLNIHQSHIRKVKDTLAQIRNTSDELSFESELFTQLHQFLCGDYSGKIDVSYSFTVTSNELFGTVTALFVEENEDFTVELSSSYDDIFQVTEVFEDILLLVLQYNLTVISFDGETTKQGSELSLSGSGELGVPVKVKKSSENEFLISEFPRPKNRFSRLLF